MTVGEAHAAGTGSPDISRGAYGIEVTGVATPLLVRVPSDWPRLHVRTVLSETTLTAEHVGDDRARLRLRTGGHLTVDRLSATACFAVRRRLTDDELVHPFLAPAAAVVAHWTSRLSFHAAAFVVDGGAWALVGGREAGKSSTLAWLARAGYGVVTDDVLVIAAGSAYAGPRSIDLRETAARQLEVGTALGLTGARPRWRMVVPAVSPVMRFRGWIFLGWGPRLQARRLSSADCLRRLMANLTLRVSPKDPLALLASAALPAFSVTRPRSWAALDPSVECIVSLAKTEDPC